ncbi:MAG: acetyl-CoA carboxylase biotin carboxyl carrier protein [Bacteriovoracaceae bacterium]|jgi:acetyl-CoA carboxylase biotin carboxyl carrier protein
MKLENVKKFIELAKAEGVSELKYEEKDLKISVNFGAINSAPAVQYTHAAPALQAGETTSAGDDGHHKVTSPFVGTYYGQPAPGKENYIKVGDKISKGQTLCILEAMKIMNEIESDVSGEVVEICIDNESLVEFGQTLFKVRV